MNLHYQKNRSKILELVSNALDELARQHVCAAQDNIDLLCKDYATDADKLEIQFKLSWNNNDCLIVQTTFIDELKSL